jgi:DNA-binding GntR family transcriptional regulator
MASNSLSAQIAWLIVDHIRTNQLTSGRHLPSQALADAFRVSRAPVSSALKALEDLGVVRSEPNRGYFLAIDPKDLRNVDLPRDPDEEEDIYFAIAEHCLSGKLGAQVTESELMRLYRLPRGRLVKILNKIAQEGWIERLPGHGWEFRPALTSRESYEAGYRFRAIVEPAAILEPRFRINVEAVRAARQQQQELLQGGLLRLSGAQLSGIDSELHELIVACSGNEFMLEGVRRVNRLQRLIEYRMTLDRSLLTRQCREHVKILDLLEAGDLPAAASFLQRHIDGTAVMAAAVGG